jgi:hypothetical protein
MTTWLKRTYVCILPQLSRPQRIAQYKLGDHRVCKRIIEKLLGYLKLATSPLEALLAQWGHRHR